MPELPNLFRFASRELHQDAFLAWLISWASPAYARFDDRLHLSAKSVVEALLAGHSTLRGVTVGEVDSVQTQTKNIDVFARVTLSSGRKLAVVIENKTTSGRHDNQLARYRAWVEARHPECEFVGIYCKTGWLDASDRQLPPGYVLVDREALLRALREHECKHPIYQEYLAYLAQVDERYRSNISDLATPDRMGYALSHAHVQWHLMESLFGEISPGWLYHGTNQGGAPWTQFGFHQMALPSGANETLFWRLDQRKPRRGGPVMPYLAVRQHQHFDRRDEAQKGAKLERLERYRNAWRDTFGADELRRMPLVASKPVADHQGKFESEVGVFFMGPGHCSLQDIRQWLPRFHAELEARIRLVAAS
ncbi:MAG: PD-(D/E)XK nuclease family protein [Myxococcales bacterium]|nr:PD-(D/E)XK nuclease family protein [Myxococcales bacterium]